MTNKIEQLEKRIKELEKHAKIDPNIYPIFTPGKMWVSKTHWYYNDTIK